MRVEGAILPVGNGSRVNREAWCQLIERRPELRRPEPRQVINPFTREPMAIHPAPGVAEVIVDGLAVGKVYWSMSEDDPLVNVSVERSALPLVLLWAAELGGSSASTHLPPEPTPNLGLQRTPASAHTRQSSARFGRIR